MTGKKTPGQQIRSYRRKLGVSQTVFAKLLNCTLNDLSLYENDKKQLSKIRRLYFSAIIPDFTPDMLTAEGQKPVDG